MKRKAYIQRNAPLVRKIRLRRSVIKKSKVDTGEYYSWHIGNMKGVCENCGCFIPFNQEWQPYAAQCHILDKEKFPEVASEPDNHWEGCLACHDRQGNAPDRIVMQMRILPVLKERLRKFIDKVHLDNIYKIPKYLFDNDTETKTNTVAN